MCSQAEIGMNLIYKRRILIYKRRILSTLLQFLIFFFFFLLEGQTFIIGLLFFFFFGLNYFNFALFYTEGHVYIQTHSVTHST